MKTGICLHPILAGYKFSAITSQKLSYGQLHLRILLDCNFCEKEILTTKLAIKAHMKKVRYIDLFCGIGGFHYAIDMAASRLSLESECVFASDIDDQARQAYSENFGMYPEGDITKFSEQEIPDHDILLAGFPCQAFSIIGDRKGFDDTRGTLFFDIARILQEKRPSGFVLENVKQLKGHDNGRTLDVILETLKRIGYDVQFKILNALDFGLPQKRERIFIVGWLNSLIFDWEFEKKQMTELKKILEKKVDDYYFASEGIKERRAMAVKEEQIQHKRPTIWHENKSGNISAYEYSCALRAGASYNYLLVNGERRLTEREMLRLQGFPDDFRVVHNYSTVRRFAGNSLPVPVAHEVIYRLLEMNSKMPYGDKRSKIKKSDKN
jgi:DNA (cytosine-5)-methyltransferase 1